MNSASRKLMCRGWKSLLKLVERVMGIEPTSSAWKAEVLPLNYTRLEDDAEVLNPDHRICRVSSPDPLMVEGVGFEPTKA